MSIKRINTSKFTVTDAFYSDGRPCADIGSFYEEAGYKIYVHMEGEMFKGKKGLRELFIPCSVLKEDWLVPHEERSIPAPGHGKDLEE